MPQEALASFNLQYNNLVDRFSRSAANSSPSGNVGKRKHRNNVIDIDPTDARSKQLVEEIVKKWGSFWRFNGRAIKQSDESTWSERVFWSICG